MNLPFRQKKPAPEVSDAILADLPRGESGRAKSHANLPQGYFESVEVLSNIGFKDHNGFNFLGVVNGTTRTIVRADGRTESQTLGGTPIGVLDDRHITTIAGSRSGKGRSIIIPNLLSYKGSMIVIDPKGENTSITARYRSETLGHEVHVIDPFNITPEHCKKYRKQYNPLSITTLDNLNLVEDAGLVADAIVVSQNAKDPHWDETAKAWIEGIILHVATGPFPREKRTLITVADLLFGKIMPTDNLLAEMMDNPMLDGRIAAAALAVEEKPKNERGSVISTARRHMKFCDYEAIASVLSGHDFDLNELKTRKTTIYVVLPATRMNSCKGLLRLFVNLTLGMVEVESTKPKFPIMAILDEMPVLGYMKELENAIGQVAGLGLRLHCILQDLGQLKAIYKDRFESFLGNSGIINAFGNVDEFTSKWISTYLGKTSIRTTDQSAVSIDDKARGSSGQSYRTQTLQLMEPNEVRRYFARDDSMNRQLVCIPGKRPWIIQRVNYDQHELFQGRFDTWR